jgi:hypothetical protein
MKARQRGCNGVRETERQKVRISIRTKNAERKHDNARDLVGVPAQLGNACGGRAMTDLEILGRHVGFDSSHKPVTRAGNSNNVFVLIGLFSEELPNNRDVPRQADLLDNGVRPDLTHQFFLADDFTVAPNQ